MTDTTTDPAPADAASLHTPVIAWFDEHARDLPWRRPE
ncbi:MAG TPA: A/G-specific adenine glycosylase, partial [Streptomyces sp.]|nr:A/G-specific adenine glycosylase [Streptomyces sp.]